MRNKTFSLELTKEELETTRFAVSADLEIVNNSINFGGADDWLNDSLVLSRVLTKLNELAQPEHGIHSAKTKHRI